MLFYLYWNDREQNLLRMWAHYTWAPRHSSHSKGKLYLIYPAFDIITFGPSCLLSQASVQARVSNVFWCGKWLHLLLMVIQVSGVSVTCSLSIVTAIVLVWSAGCGVTQLKINYYWGRISPELNQLSELVTVCVSVLWRSRARERLWHAGTWVILAMESYIRLIWSLSNLRLYPCKKKDLQNLMQITGEGSQILWLLQALIISHRADPHSSVLGTCQWAWPQALCDQDFK